MCTNLNGDAVIFCCSTCNTSTWSVCWIATLQMLAQRIVSMASLVACGAAHPSNFPLGEHLRRDAYPRLLSRDNILTQEQPSRLQLGV